MADDCLLSLIYAAWLAAATMPLGFMLGASCSPCCGCTVADGKPRTDPVNEGTWVPSGTWRGVGGVTWTFTANPGDDSGETWFFYGSESTSRFGGGASTAERRDWGNVCNWYSNKTTSPSTTSGLPTAFDKRATRLPPETAVVHVYTPVSTASAGPQTVKTIFFWGDAGFVSGSEVTTTAAAHDSTGGAVFNNVLGNEGTINGGATFNDSSDNRSTVNDGATFNGATFNSATVNGGATFNDSSANGESDIVNGGATFNDSSNNIGTINDGATFNDSSSNSRTVNGGATFNDSSDNLAIVNGGATFNGLSENVGGTINGGATFNDDSRNRAVGIVNDGATFNDSSQNSGNSTTVNGGATFNDSSNNIGTINGGATFNGNSRNRFTFNAVGTVNGGATFNDAACSERVTGFFGSPCTRKFVAHPTDLPTCNGTAPDGCANAADTCGCG